MAIINFYWTCKASIHSNYSPETTVYIAEQTGHEIGTALGQQNTGWVDLPAYSQIPGRTGYTLVGYSQTNGATSPSMYAGSTMYWTQADSWMHTFDVYCVWRANTYTVSYNANGGSGAPSNQTKTYGENLTLSSTVPTRTNYIFQGWATSSTGAVAYQPGGTYTANAGVTLYAIWAVAAATLNRVDNVTIGTSGGTGVASWTIAKSSHKYWLKFVLSGASDAYYPSGTTYVPPGTSSVTFTIPSHWLNALSSSTSATATAILYSFDGDTFVGTTQKTFMVSVDSSVKPTISSFTASHYSANATVSGWGVFVQGFSKADLSVSATAGTGASISSISFTGTSINTSGTATTARTGIIDAYGTVTFTVKVTDSRGRSTTSTVSVTVQPYAAPVVISIGTMRADADGTTNNSSGAYLKVLPIYSLSSVDGRNSFTAQTLSYYAHGSSTPLASISCVSSTTYGPPGNLWAINLADTYDVAVSVTDALGSTTTKMVTLPGASGLWYDRSNNALGLGAPPSAQNMFSCDWNAEFHGTVDVTPRRCSAELSSVGWYRVLSFETNETLQKGGYPFVIDLCIRRAYNNNNNELHKVSLLVDYNNIVFGDEVSLSNMFYIRGIRYTTSSTKSHIDIQYSLSSANNVSVDFTVHALPSMCASIKAESLQSVADAPAGETVQATYVPAQNCIPESKWAVWTNPSPASGFAAQTVNIDLSRYSMVEIEFTPYADDTRKTVRCPVGKNCNLFFMFINTDTASDVVHSLGSTSRSASVTTSGITFGNGQMLYNGDVYQNWTNRSIPTKIWGIK